MKLRRYAKLCKQMVFCHFNYTFVCVRERERERVCERKRERERERERELEKEHIIVDNLFLKPCLH